MGKTWLGSPISSPSVVKCIECWPKSWWWPFYISVLVLSPLPRSFCSSPMHFFQTWHSPAPGPLYWLLALPETLFLAYCKVLLCLSISLSLSQFFKCYLHGVAPLGHSIENHAPHPHPCLSSTCFCFVFFYSTYHLLSNSIISLLMRFILSTSSRAGIFLSRSGLQVQHHYAA